jgi:hypothetical protein
MASLILPRLSPLLAERRLLWLRILVLAESVASDCKTLVKDIKSGSKGHYGPIIEEIKTRATLLQECSFVFEGQAVNFEAHNLARFATTLGIGRHLWLSIPYDNIPVNS